MLLSLFLPLTAAIVYTLGSLLTKRGFHEGAKPPQAFHLTNIVIGLTFLPMLLLETKPIDWGAFHHVLINGIMFFLGNHFAFLAIHRGDVSIVTPVMGTKVVFVAIFATLLIGQSVPLPLWIAALLTPFGILILGFKDIRKGDHIWLTLAYSLASACSFGCCDVLVRLWARGFAPFAFLSFTAIGLALYSLVRLLNHRPLWTTLTSSARFWIIFGAILTGLQAMLVGTALAFSDQPTRINVIYASRGLWSIVLVWALGRALKLHEKKQSSDVFAWRLIGTVLLTAAIILALLAK